MFAISTAAFVSVLALASSMSSLGVAGQATTGPRSQCTEKYNVPQGETCDALASKFGLNQASIQSLNPGIACNGTLSANQVLCVKVQTPTCTRSAAATNTTCDALASQCNITSKEFVKYNGDVNDDCNNLVVGQSYCVAIDASFPKSTVSVNPVSSNEAGGKPQVGAGAKPAVGSATLLGKKYSAGRGMRKGRRSMH